MRLEDMQIRIDIADRPWCFALLWIAGTGEQFCAAVSDAEVLRLHIGIDADICRGDEGCVVGTTREQDDCGQRRERTKVRHCFSSATAARVADRAVTGFPRTRALSRNAAVVSRLKPAVR